MPRFENSATRVFPARRDVVWAIVADSNRMNRAFGNVPGHYAWREVEGKREYVATARELGQDLEWLEPPYQWVEGEFIDAVRKFLKGPVKLGFAGVRLRDVPGGTECEMRMGFSGDGVLLSLLGPIVGIRHRAALRRSLDAVEQILRDGEAFIGDASEPAVMRAQRMLTTGYHEITSGPRTPVDGDSLRARTEVLGRSALDAALVERLRTWLDQRPDEEVAQMRPFELARLWGVDRREVLRLFLHATRAGLVDLRWQINCPVCRVSAQVAASLEEVGSEVHCGACNLPYGVDFGRYVEAVFQTNPQIRRVTPALFCASSPAWRPHVYAQLTIPASGTHTAKVTLPLGEVHLRCLQPMRPADCTLQHAPQQLTIEIDDTGIRARPEGRAEDGRTKLQIVSRATAPHTLLIERSGWNADQVLGSIVASFPDFLDLFATEAPATGVELSVGHLTVLFSDLTGSTALYQRVGDAKAFAVVESHFSIMERAINQYEGALVKTMGDAVMATFPSPLDGVRAATAMVRAHDLEHGPIGLGVKLGLHTGACLAVRANDRLDFFGTTINFAARLQAQAHAGELVLTEELAKDPRVAELLSGLPQRSFETQLKGIDASQRLIGFDCTAAAKSSG